jgi:hypothetical protein
MRRVRTGGNVSPFYDRFNTYKPVFIFNASSASLMGMI